MSMKDDVYMICADDFTDSAQDLIDAATGEGAPADVRRRPVAVGAPAPRDAVAGPAAVPGGAHGLHARSSKRPAIASTLSLIVCGAGQIYNRQMQLGLLFLLTEVLFVVGHWSVQRLWPAIRETAALLGVGEAGLLVGAAAADVAMIAVAAGSVGQAYGRADRAAGGGFDGIRVPLVSGIGSLLVPGWGQILNAQIGKGLFFLVFMHAAAVALAYTLLTPLGEVVSPTLPVVFGVIGAAAMMWVLSVYDAVLVAGTRRRGA